MQQRALDSKDEPLQEITPQQAHSERNIDFKVLHVQPRVRAA
jgi:hypothetical protein